MRLRLHSVLSRRVSGQSLSGAVNHRSLSTVERPGGGPLWLKDLPRGATAIVDRVQGNGDLSRQLAETGFVPGTRIQLVRGGSPCLVQIGGSRMAVGDEAAGAVRVLQEAA